MQNIMFEKIKNYLLEYKLNRMQSHDESIRSQAVDEVTIRRIEYGVKTMIAIVVRGVVVYVTPEENTKDITDKMLEIRDLYFASRCSAPEIAML